MIIGKGKENGRWRWWVGNGAKGVDSWNLSLHEVLDDVIPELFEGFLKSYKEKNGVGSHHLDFLSRKSNTPSFNPHPSSLFYSFILAFVENHVSKSRLNAPYYTLSPTTPPILLHNLLGGIWDHVSRLYSKSIKNHVRKCGTLRQSFYIYDPWHDHLIYVCHDSCHDVCHNSCHDECHHLYHDALCHYVCLDVYH